MKQSALWKLRRSLLPLLLLAFVVTTCTATEKKDTKKEQAIVHITRTGKKYHRAGCRSLSRSDIPVTLEEAKQRGYDPCKVCTPPTKIDEQ